jgi:hypothetical protein
MATTYNWTISAMDCVPQEDGKTDVVVTAHWNVSATEGIYTSNAYGTQLFIYDAGKAFIPYSSLTQEQVIAWVQESMGIDAVTALQQNIDQQLADQINPPIVTPPLPWPVTIPAPV